MSKRWAGLFIVCLLLLSAAVPAYGAQKSSEKEEVVYADLEDSGRTKQVYVVNIFEGTGEIRDYGDYQSVRNMSSTDEISREGEQIRISTNEEILYYQGNLKEGEIPWDIGIAYFLDGQEKTAGELAGAGGDLKIKIKIAENKEADPDFFQNYALQVTAALDTQLCWDIKAEGATEANVGGARQFTWTLLPGTEKTLTLSAKVSDFEMDSISFNGVKLNMDVDIDEKELTDKFEDLEKATAAIDAGASQLSQGASDLNEGVQTVKKKTEPLKKTGKEMEKKLKQAGKLETASGEIKGAAQALAQGTQALKEGIGYQSFKQAMAQQGLDLDALKSGNQELMKTLENLKQIIPESYQGEVAKAEQVLQGNLGAIQGMEQYLNQAQKSISQADAGADALAEQYGTFDEAIKNLCGQLEEVDLSQLSKLSKGARSLAEGSESLKQGSEALAEGTQTLKNETSGMGEKTKEQIQDALKNLTGEEGKTNSFVSEKNTNVKGVQFVIKNDAIALPEEEAPAETQEKQQSWWQKLLALFGIS